MQNSSFIIPILAWICHYTSCPRRLIWIQLAICNDFYSEIPTYTMPLWARRRRCLPSYSNKTSLSQVLLACVYPYTLLQCSECLDSELVQNRPGHHMGSYRKRGRVCGESSGWFTQKVGDAISLHSLAGDAISLHSLGVVLLRAAVKASFSPC